MNKSAVILMLASLTVSGYAVAGDDPAPDARFVYVVGDGEGRSAAIADDRARADALNKFTSIVGVSIYVETVDVMSAINGAESSSIQVMTASRARAQVHDEVLVKKSTSRNRWPWPFRRYKSTSVYRWPVATLKREQRRQESIEEAERLEAMRVLAGKEVEKYRVAVEKYRADFTKVIDDLVSRHCATRVAPDQIMVDATEIIKR